jgi:hypothetical protein
VKNIGHLGVELLSFTCLVLHLFFCGLTINFFFLDLRYWVLFLAYSNLFEIKNFVVVVSNFVYNLLKN